MSRYRVTAKLDLASPCEATVSIDRERGLFHVRPLYRRRTFTLPLGDVATLVVLYVLKHEAEPLARPKKVRRGLL